MDLNLANAQIAVRRKLLEDISPLQIVAPVQVKDHQAIDPEKTQATSAIGSSDSLTKLEVKRVLERFQPLTPLLKTALDGAHALRQGFQNLKNLTRDQTETPIAATPPTNSNQALPLVSPMDKNTSTPLVDRLEKTVTPQQSNTNINASTKGNLGQPAKVENLPAGGNVPVAPLAFLKAPAAARDNSQIDVSSIHPTQPGRLIPPTRPRGEDQPRTVPVNNHGVAAGPRQPKAVLGAWAAEKLGQPSKAENLPAGSHIQTPSSEVKNPETHQDHPTLDPQAVHPTRQSQPIPPTQSRTENRPITVPVNNREQSAVPQQAKATANAQTEAFEKLRRSSRPENLPVGGHVSPPPPVGVNVPETTHGQSVPNVQAIHPTNQSIQMTKPAGGNQSPIAPVDRFEKPVFTEPSNASTGTQTQTAENLGKPAETENLPAGGPSRLPQTVGSQGPETSQDQPVPHIQAVHSTQPIQPISQTKPTSENHSQTTQLKSPEGSVTTQRTETPTTTQTQATENLGRPAKSENLPAGGPAQTPQTVGTKAPETEQARSLPNVQAIHPIQASRSVPPIGPEAENRPQTPQLNRPEKPLTPLQAKTPAITQVQTAENLGQRIRSENLPAGGPEEPPKTAGIKPHEGAPNHPGPHVQVIHSPQPGQPILPVQQEGGNPSPLVQTGNGQQGTVQGHGEIPKGVQVSVGTTVQQPANHENVPAGGNPQVPVAVTPRVPSPTEKNTESAPRAVRPVRGGQPVHEARVETTPTAQVPKGTGERRTIIAHGENLPKNSALITEKAVPSPAVLSPAPPISAVPEAQAPLSSVAQSQIEGMRPLVIPSGAPVGGAVLAPGLTKNQAIQVFQRNLREAGSRTTVEEARKTTDLLQQHPLVNSQPVVLTTPETLRDKVGSTDETVTRLAGPGLNNPNLGAEIVARTPVRGDNRASTEPIGIAEKAEMGPQNGSRLPARPPAHAVPPLLNVNSQLRQPLPTNARSRLVAVPTVNLLDLSL